MSARSRRFRALLTGLFLIAAPPQTFGGCAWVLWGNVVRKTVDVWQTDEAFDNKGECDQAVRARLGKAKAMNATVIGDMVLIEKADTIITYHCLPDTVDPRGPRGGTR
jgi:hypothetical protein